MKYRVEYWDAKMRVWDLCLLVADRREAEVMMRYAAIAFNTRTRIRLGLKGRPLKHAVWPVAARRRGITPVLGD